ncbi:MAG: aminotransferase class I/II-fold pyridoxal phosphate-dependent enzyme [bacterium]
MKIIEDYLKKDLGKPNLANWEEIRESYLDRAARLVRRDYQSPSYLASLRPQAGRREGKIIGNINDYTRDQHDLAFEYEKKFVKEYLPRVSLLPIEAYVTSSGMAALATVIMTLRRLHGTDQVVLLGKHSYFQNQEIIMSSFAKVVVFDETDESEWGKLILEEKPRAIFVDSLCNESNMTMPPVAGIAKYLSQHAKEKTYLVIDNSLQATQFDWRSTLKWRNRKLEIVGWESLNKYYQFGLDRTTGGIVWAGNIMLSVKMLQARRHAGTIMSDIAVAMLPTPNKKAMQKYLERIWQNRERLLEKVGERGVGAGAQVVIKFAKKYNYEQIQKIIKRIIVKAKKDNVQIVAGTSFGFPSTRIYLTARQTEYAQMFLRVSVGTEEKEEFEKISRAIISCL